MKLFEKRIRFGLLVVFTSFFLFSCGNLINKVTGKPDDVPLLTAVSPDSDTLAAGTVVEVSFKCDELDVVRVSYQNDEEEIEYEYIEKQNGAFKKKLWIPVQATKVQLYVVEPTNSIYEGSYYVGKKWTVTGTKPFSAYTTPDSYATANTYRTDKPEAFIEGIAADAALEAKRKSDPLAYVQDVCAKIKTEAGSDDFKKAKMIHDLLALIIPYDMEGVKKSPMPPQDYWTVLKTGKGVCQGYALTYKKFCEIIGIECDYVFGWNRTATHAWNIVKLEGKCYLLDTTWDAGREVGGAFNKNYITEYFLIEPEVFKYQHFPEYEKHQLLKTPVASKEAFYALPDLKPIFFDAIQNPESNALVKLTDKVVNSTDGKYSFKYKLAITDKYIDFSVRDKDMNKVSSCFFINKGEENEVNFSFPKAEKYTVRAILINNGESEGNVCAEFNVNVATPSTVEYVKQVGPFVKTVTPFEGPLEVGKTYTFTVSYSSDPDDSYIAYYTADNTRGKVEGASGSFVTMEKNEDGSYTKEITVPVLIKI